MQRALDDMDQATGHKNAYFRCSSDELPREGGGARRGFAKESPLTHTRLRATGKQGKDAIEVDPTSALEEPPWHTGRRRS